MSSQSNGHLLVSLEDQLAQLAAQIPDLQHSDSPLAQQWAALREEITQRERQLAEITTLYNGSQAVGAALSERQIFEALFDQIQREQPAEISAFTFRLVNAEPIWAELKATWPQKGEPFYPVGRRFFLPETPEVEWLNAFQPIFIEDVPHTTILSDLEQANFAAMRAASVAILPFAMPDQRLGALLVRFDAPYQFSAMIKRFWQGIVEQAAVLLANRQLIQEVTYHAVQIETGADVARTASSILDVNQLLNSAVRLIRDRFDLYYVGVFLVDQTESWAVLRAGTGEAGRTQIENKHRLKIGGESMIGWCLANQKAKIALDVGREAVHFQNPHLPLTRSEMALPLIYHRQPIGALTVQSVEPAAFTQADIVFLQTMADQLANAIQNAHLFEQAQQEINERRRIEQEILQRNNELAAINRITEAITSTLDPQNVLRATTREMAQIFNARTCGIGLLNPAQTELQIVADYSLEPEIENSEGTIIPVTGNPSSLHVINTGEPLVIDNPQTNQWTTPIHELMRLRHTECLMIVPLRASGEVIGTIGLDSTQPGRSFSQAEVKLAETLAGQVATAIEKARLFEETLRRNEELAAISRIGAAITATLDKQAMLRAIAREMVHIFKARRCGVALYNPDRTVLKVEAAYSSRSAADAVEGIDLAVVAEADLVEPLTQGKPVVVPQVQSHPAFAEAKEMLRALETESIMLVPLLAHNQLIGTIGVDLDVPDREFSSTEIKLAETIAGQVARAVENAYLFDEMQAALADRQRAEEALHYRIELEELVATTSQHFINLQSNEINQGVNNILHKISRFFAADRGYIFLLEADETRLINSHEWCAAGVEPFLERLQELPVEQMSWWLAQMRQFKVIHAPSLADLPAEAATEKELLAAQGTRSMIAVPMISSGKVIGLLGCNSNRKEKSWSEYEIKTFRIVAQVIAGALARQQNEKALQANQALLQAIIDNASAPIYVLDRQGRFLLANEPFAKGFGLDKALIIGKTDYELFPEQIAQDYQGHDLELLANETTVREEETLPEGYEQRTYVTIKFPLYDASGTAYALCGIATDITERRQAEQALQAAFKRTQSLYRINNTLATETERTPVFEVVLREYLNLLDLDRGGLVLLQGGFLHSLYIDGPVVNPAIGLPIERKMLTDNLLNSHEPLIIEDVHNHPLTKDNPDIVDKVTASLFIPLVIQGEVVGVMAADATEPGYIFSQNNIEIGQAIADQFSIWLQNKQLMEETQHRSQLLHTGAEISKTASSILEADELIDVAVNLIRDKFDFYYVGLFLIEEAWAVLKAGTGEAGQIQLNKKHRLAVGGESMIGWSVAHRQARIALDVGEDAVHFENPDLPLTRSEMALPLVSRDEVIGALTVQSVEPGAFSDEDITVLQMMADQLANAIKNARLFEEITVVFNEATAAQTEAEERLQETIALQQLSQALSSTLNTQEILDIFFGACTKVFGFDYLIFSQVDGLQNRIKALAGIGVAESHLKQINYALDSDNFMAEIIRTSRPEIIHAGNTDFQPAVADWTGPVPGTRLFIPISLRQENVGLVEAGFTETRPNQISEAQLGLMRAFIDQTILALDNAQRYENSQRKARREALIKQITTRVRASNDVETILQTTVKELGTAFESKNRRAYAHLTSPNSNVVVDREQANE